MHPVARALVGSILLASPPVAFSAPADDTITVQLIPVKDASLYEECGCLANGAGERLFTGRTHVATLRRALLAFDVSSIPASAEIEDARLEAHVSNSVSGPVACTVHRLLADFGEGGSNAGEPGGIGATAQAGDATWSHAFWPDTPWASPGGDFAAVPSATQDLGVAGDYEWNGPGLAADVQAWVSGAAPNFGWIVLGDEILNGSAKRLDSRENTEVTVRPVLTVRYRATIAVESWSWGRLKAASR